ncbi:hypothetical protein LJ737_13520 [Hymenobacter sp. 15J16-1T3B]|uniref:hypothetical protein n=1 Tax=Hymenobacter sp. 15J16-1T3B TaxID=2886941 RepID=UPI001D0F74EC|nr:hypothetical protein [Hymenobacter sp. 15J16-1T3B]MCC3158262.1 hypothetical protein [Hymenobacter sp. 15J16-1T3B]
MLDLLKRGTVPLGSATWEYHGDTADQTIFYITPQPVWVMNGALPSIQLVEYKTEGSLNGAGYCTLQLQLSVPDAAVQAVRQDIEGRYGVKPRFLTLPFQPGTIVNLTYPDGQGGTTGMQAAGTDFGSNGAIFQLPLDADQMKTFKQVLGKQGGSPFEVQYAIQVPSLMPAVKVAVSFDSSIALQYQVTSHEHTHWASSSTYTYDISKQLTASNAAKIVVDKINPNVPEALMQSLRAWGQSVVEARVADAVKAALALQNSAGGTQSFSASQISSFKETYEENQTILWRLMPQTVLPSFADLGLTVAQIESLEPVVDKRKFVTQVTPKCNFVGSEQSLNPSIEPDKDSVYMSDKQKLKRLEVTIKYPTLNDKADRTHTFTDNTPYTWEADWDELAGGVYTLEYSAVYEDSAQPTVTGTAEDIDATNYTITLADIGILNVTFDASIFFGNSESASLVDKLIVNFVFDIPQAPPVLLPFTLDAENTSHVVSSLTAAPIETDYTYTITYIFKPEAKANPYTSDAKSQNGQWVRLAEPDLAQSVSVVVDMTGVYKARVNIYYTEDPYFPNIPASEKLPRPTAKSPIQLVFPAPKTGGGAARGVADDFDNLLATAPLASATDFAAGELGAPQWEVQTARYAAPVDQPQAKTNGVAARGLAVEDDPDPSEQDVNLFANSKLAPLQITASVLTKKMKQINIGPFNFNPQNATFFVLTATQTFVMIGADPTIVDWNELNLINVRITAVRYTEPGTAKAGTKTTYEDSIDQQAIGLDAVQQKSYSAYFQVPNLPVGYTGLEFDWEADYVYNGGTKTAAGTVQGTQLTLPKSAAEAPAAPAARAARAADVEA